MGAKNWQEAIKYPKWKELIKAEYNALLQNHTWDLVL